MVCVMCEDEVIGTFCLGVSVRLVRRIVTKSSLPREED